MIEKYLRFIEKMNQRVYFASLTTIALLVYGIRGAGYKREIYGDDLDLFIQAVNRTKPGSGIQKLDYLGLFDPYNGYLVVLLRAFTRIALIGPDSKFTFNAYVLMTVFFATSTALTCSLISKSTSRNFGLLALFFCIFLPFSNLVILAQINTVAWPLALLMMVITSLRVYPTSKSGKIFVAILFSLTAMSSGAVVVAMLFLFINIAVNFRNVRRYELSLLLITSVSFLIQWFTYTPRTNPKLPLLGELHKSLYNFSPQFIREKIGLPLNGDEQIIFYIVPLMLLTIWIVQASFAWYKNWESVFSAIKLFAGGLILLCLLIRGNGWFNTHYLFIPTSMFWISLVVLFHANRDDPSIRIALPVSLILFGTTISGVYYLL